jgi:hypothetical protein
VVSIDSLWLAIAPMDIFFNLKGLRSLKSINVFSALGGTFFGECSVNVESAANVCGSGALQAAITVIAACVVLLPLL